MRKPRLYFSFPAAVWIALWLYYDRNGSAVCSICAAVLHECGHLLALWSFCDLPRSIRIGTFGVSIVRCGTVKLTYRQEIFTAAAGPAVNLLLCCILTVCSLFRPTIWIGVQVNLALALFNMLPLRTLDGGQILYAALCRRMLPHDAASVCKTIAVITAIPLTAIGWIRFRNGYGIYSLMLSLFSVVSVVLP